ncbi:MAG: hypothetical protein JRI23_10050 [Deltaproteobacteria bacterium]|jgi:glyceraldehyde 3-phosphate dehydrogenase|nr:hypothetical protein [Deltaproteobacteria bacterium]MBW2532014.1 hypothetical protein [Deltaproteobacteria bacterium]
MIATTRSVSCGINGFGRFALHLLKYWLQRRVKAHFHIEAINDDLLDVEQALEIIHGDPYVRFDEYCVWREGDELRIQTLDGSERAIRYTNESPSAVDWLGQPEVVLECSGKLTEARRCRFYLTGRTERVLISATSWDSDATLVYGFNHRTFNPAVHRLLSYGSCTVNGYVPLAQHIHDRYGVLDSDVNVVHNIVRHRLAEHDTLLRKPCTLERSAPRLLPFIDEGQNFVVTYSVVPWDGVSMIDFRFRCQRPPASEQALVAELEAALGEGGALRGLYSMVDSDAGPQAHNCTPYSAVFVKEGIKLRRDNVYLQAYFDTENSVNRYFDLLDYICESSASRVRPHTAVMPQSAARRGGGDVDVR